MIEKKLPTEVDAGLTGLFIEPLVFRERKNADELVAAALSDGVDLPELGLLLTEVGRDLMEACSFE